MAGVILSTFLSECQLVYKIWNWHHISSGSLSSKRLMASTLDYLRDVPGSWVQGHIRVGLRKVFKISQLLEKKIGDLELKYYRKILKFTLCDLRIGTGIF